MRKIHLHQSLSSNEKEIIVISDSDSSYDDSDVEVIHPTPKKTKLKKNVKSSRCKKSHKAELNNAILQLGTHRKIVQKQLKLELNTERQKAKKNVEQKLKSSKNISSFKEYISSNSVSFETSKSSNSDSSENEESSDSSFTEDEESSDNDSLSKSEKIEKLVNAKTETTVKQRLPNERNPFEIDFIPLVSKQNSSLYGNWRSNISSQESNSSSGQSRSDSYDSREENGSSESGGNFKSQSGRYDVSGERNYERDFYNKRIAHIENCERGKNCVFTRLGKRKNNQFANGRVVKHYGYRQNYRRQ